MNVKECLQPKGISRFQTLMLELRSNFILKNSSESSQLCFKSSNLPPHINPMNTSFGYRRRSSLSLADILNEKYNIDNNARTDKTRIKYIAEQLNRNYKKPFDKNKVYGTAYKVDTKGCKVQKILSYESEIHNFQHSDHESKKPDKFPNFVMCTLPDNNDRIDIYELLHEIPVNKKRIMMEKCLSHINKIRLQIRKQDSTMLFINLIDKFCCIDTNSVGTVSLNEFYNTLNKVKIILDPNIFEYLLKELNFIKEKSVYYEKALNLLNNKYDFPPIAKMNDMPKENHFYTTTYQHSMKPHV